MGAAPVNYIQALVLFIKDVAFLFYGLNFVVFFLYVCHTQKVRPCKCRRPVTKFTFVRHIEREVALVFIIKRRVNPQFNGVAWVDGRFQEQGKLNQSARYGWGFQQVLKISNNMLCAFTLFIR